MEYLEQLISKTNQIRKDTESKFNIIKVIKYVNGFNSWTRDAPVPARPIWETAMFEASAITNASFFLAIHGFYEEACSLLRGIIDGFLTRLYWDEKDRKGTIKIYKQNGRSTNEYWEWESGTSNEYPPLKKVAETLIKRVFIKKYNDQYGLWQDIENLLKKLNKFVHGRPETRHYGYATRSSSGLTEFKEKHFEEWYKYLKKIYSIISILSILQYPDLINSAYIKEFKELEQDSYVKVKNIFKG